MRLLPDDDEVEFASTLRRLLSVGSASPTLWNSLADAGVLGLALPEEHGGSGGHLTDLGTFYVEAGRGLCPTLVHGTIQAGLAIDALGTAEQHATLLPGLASGRSSATTALWSPVDASNVTPSLLAEATGSTWVLSGCVDFVLDADRADYVVVSARESVGDRNLVFVIPMNEDSLRTEPLALMGYQGAARVHFDGVVVEGGGVVLGADEGVTDEQLHRLANAATALLSLDLVGVGEAALQRTVDHTTMRHQFGRPIASFQAAQHLVANMHIALAAARLAAWSAVSLLADGHTATRQTAVARMHAASAAKLVTLDAHQLHGGMGYVVDTDLHRYSERARVLSTLGGGADVAATWLQRGAP
ncbi:acyl-CoA dehydrogenase family protein [Mycolicibacterium sp.]|uniref:acyl-CoA dehydrogenase family protein n=1 Tax=Mycolicibacterium sp. TaxID=2320850 RepID=UPI001A2BD83D|nr:acyl-CoA dehydrogenase family protein [Mycolicibacterium sp.]MBJ7336093.1 acyl-CoA/acyl-ACP dehydrogenase [Mycolicibacterium sp.]